MGLNQGATYVLGKTNGLIGGWPLAGIEIYDRERRWEAQERMGE